MPLLQAGMARLKGFANAPVNDGEITESQIIKRILIIQLQQKGWPCIEVHCYDQAGVYTFEARGGEKPVIREGLKIAREGKSEEILFTTEI